MNTGQIEVDRHQPRLESAGAKEVLRWAKNTFGKKAAATSSFQTQSVPLLHLISEHAPELPVLFLDTGFHFPETLEFRDRLAEELGLNVRSLTPRLGHEGFRKEHGKLHQRDPDLCCYLNKVEPLEDALDEYDLWISGIRRDQTEARASASVLERQEDGTLKACPMLEWTSRDIFEYIGEHDLPVHPLFEEGYLSIGCAPCTRPPEDGGGRRGGRWADAEKTECGLHTGFGEDGPAADSNGETA